MVAICAAVARVERVDEAEEVEQVQRSIAREVGVAAALVGDAVAVQVQAVGLRCRVQIDPEIRHPVAVHIAQKQRMGPVIGDLRAGSHDNSGMYSQGQATIVLCEAFAMTGDEQLRIPAQKAVDFIVKAQYRDGGWRYQPGPPTQRGDTSVVGWQLMALQSARAANLTVPADTLGMAEAFLESVSQQEGALYGYQSGHSPTPAMTAEGLLCRMYLGWKKSNPNLGRGVRWLVDEHLPSESSPNIYYLYYGTQTLHHFGGDEWDQWNVQMRDLLVRSQEKGGHVAGSWAPRDHHAYAGGRIYQTSLSICSLEVYYRHLPIFKQIELGAKNGKAVEIRTAP